jgi:5-formyltetrahydrofolate cyclo-ligase
MDDVAAWRKVRRVELIARRQAVAPDERRQWSAAIERNLRTVFAGRTPACLSFYWPFRGEIDLRPLVRELLELGWRATLPVVVKKASPLEFRPWTPDAAMEDGIWNIPQPRDGPPVTPDLVLSPVVGFDDQRYRLGYGGGYYDRTLAVLSPRPFAIGIGFEFQRLDTIHPQPYDQRFDVIVTEAGVRR